MANGIDASVNCTEKASELQASGIEFVCRYYANSGKKVLSRAEALGLNQAGLNIVVVWEDGYPTKASYFSYAKGVDDGSSAYHDALLIGHPIESPIYFAVDYDASSADVSGGICDYFRGVAAGFAASGGGAPSHPIGVYGSGATCSFLLARSLVDFAWLSQSTGFRGSKDFADWNIKQGPEQQMLGIDVDVDESADNYGGFQLS